MRAGWLHRRLVPVGLDGAVHLGPRGGGAYLVRVGPAYAFLGLGLALYFAAQGRGRTAQPLLATLTRCWSPGRWVPGLGVFGWGIDSLFALMACGLLLYGMVMVAVMRRELWFYAGGR